MPDMTPDPEKPASTPEPCSTPQQRPEATDIERLFRDHNTALLRFIATKLGSEQEAREIAQEAYVQLLRLNHPETISYLRAFLFKTAANLAVDRLRQRGRRRQVTSLSNAELAVFEISPERQVAGEQEISVLRAAIDELPAKCRQAFLLQRVHELSSEEIAARLGLQPRMIRRYVARALDHVRARLDGAPACTEHTTQGPGPQSRKEEKL